LVQDEDTDVEMAGTKEEEEGEAEDGSYEALQF
jgi:hypothetical protein